MFLDPTNLEPYPDQWAFLSSLQRLEAQAASELANLMGELAAGPDTAIYRSPGIHGGPKPPATITAKAMAMLAIDRIGMPPAMLAALKRLASLHNPDF